MEAHFRSFGKLVAPEAVKQGIAVLGMKSMDRSVILKSNTANPVECFHYAMSQPVSVVITGMNSPKILDQALEEARAFRPITEQEVSALLAKPAKAAAHGEYELFKATAHFDSTEKHPEWLGTNTPRTERIVSTLQC